MKKHFYLFIGIFLFSALKGFSQCSNDSTMVAPGFKPDTIPHAYENQMYTQSIQFKFPTDTTVFNNKVIFDSLYIKTITGLHDSIKWECGIPTCTWVGGGFGCIALTGTPPKGSAGKYVMKITVRAYFKLGMTNTFQDFSNNVNFFIEDTTTNQTNIHQPSDVNHLNVYPNPFQDILNLNLNIEKTSNYTIQIVGMDGKIIYNSSHSLSVGDNQLPIDSKQWNSGLYMIRINNSNIGKYLKM